jgi:hypothetical protein
VESIVVENFEVKEASQTATLNRPPLEILYLLGIELKEIT